MLNPDRLYKGLCRSFFAPAAVLFLIFGTTLAQSKLDELRHQVANGSVEGKRNALNAIRGFRTEEASKLAIPALTDRNELVRATATSSIIFLPKSDAARLLIPLLNDKSEFVRTETAFALGEVGDNTTVQALINRLQKDSGRVSSAVAAALGKIGDVSAVDSLNTVLKRNPREDDENLRRSAARSMGRIAQILRAGNRRVDTPQNFLPEKYKDSYSATRSVARTFPVFRTSVSILMGVLSNKREADDVRREAAFALGAIGDPAGKAVLSNHLNSLDNYLAEICKEALLNIASGE